MPASGLAGRRVLVMGLGDSGLAMARWVASRGAALRVADTRPLDAAQLARQAALCEAIGPVECVTGGFDEAWLDGVDLVAWSPGLSIERGSSAAFHAAARARGIAVVGDLELFAQALAELRATGYRPRVLAVTGTNGKTTTTALAAHLCAAAGLSVRFAGNIRPALLEALREAIAGNALPQVWVLELSSFQLALTESFAPDAATILNISEDHLDWHASMRTYCAAKRRIYAPGTVAVSNRGDPATGIERAPRASFGADAPTVCGDFGLVGGGAPRRAHDGAHDSALVWLAQAVALDEGASAARRRREPAQVTIRRLMPADALRIRGLHNQLNAMAALGLCTAVGVPMAGMLHALRDYAGEPHRCQLIAVIDDVEYYDDSKGTNIGATLAALEGLGRRCRLIAGGDGKGQDFAALAPAVAQHASGVWLIGRDAPLLRAALADTGVALTDCADLPRAVRAAAEGARAGEAVLLSPACASLDMFRDYAHRAQVFIAAVRELAAARGISLEASC